MESINRPDVGFKLTSPSDDAVSYLPILDLCPEGGWCSVL